MKESLKSTRCKKNPPAWHAGFVPMIPAIETHAKIVLRNLKPEAREEAIQNVICLACQAYARLAELGKTDRAFPSELAKFGIAQTRTGRRLGGRLNVRDVLSDYCQRNKGIAVETLDEYDSAEECWREVLVEDKHAGPAEIAATRIDFATWLKRLSPRLRRIAKFLARGETTTAAAEKFRVSQGRISQIRTELFLAWHGFQGDGGGRGLRTQ